MPADLRPFQTPLSPSGTETLSPDFGAQQWPALGRSTVSHLAPPDFCPGKSGRIKAAMMAAPRLIAPSMTKSHYHPAIPCFSESPESTPAAMRPENAVASSTPEYREAARRAKSLRGYQVYQQLRRYIAPGKKGEVSNGLLPRNTSLNRQYLGFVNSLNLRSLYRYMQS